MSYAQVPSVGVAGVPEVAIHEQLFPHNVCTLPLAPRILLLIPEWLPASSSSTVGRWVGGELGRWVGAVGPEALGQRGTRVAR